jgi:hypothetical protein
MKYFEKTAISDEYIAQAILSDLDRMDSRHPKFFKGKAIENRRLYNDKLDRLVQDKIQRATNDPNINFTKILSDFDRAPSMVQQRIINDASVSKKLNEVIDHARDLNISRIGTLGQEAMLRNAVIANGLAAATALGGKAYVDHKRALAQMERELAKRRARNLAGVGLVGLTGAAALGKYLYDKKKVEI